MLSHISISNYTIVSELEMEFAEGMTVITGETGAGKSITLDALGLCLGDRADPKAVRHGAKRAEIAATFDISALPAASAWLDSRDLEGGDECLLRRVITAEGRSRAYINGSPSTLQDCAELGALLIDIHSQHAHQSLLRKPVQRALLDAYAGHQKLAADVEQSASNWLRAQRELELLTGSADEHASRAQLLAYQVEELDQLALGETELQELEQEQKLLANAEQILSSAHSALDLCDQQENGTRQALQLLSDDAHAGNAADSARELLDSAAIQIAEARSEIQRHLDAVEIDPERLDIVQRRLETIYDVARKHRVMPEQVAEVHQRLREELDSLAGSEERIKELQGEMASLERAYAGQAKKLSSSRSRAAKKLVKAAQEVLATLAMAQCTLEIALTPRDNSSPHPHGVEDIEFLISTNPGAAPQGLGKIASGGELSRISLAIQVVTASAGTVPSMVFDEVDVGIGGAVAEVVGKLLRDLAGTAQVLCVTHLPQVAAQGQQHLQVSKQSNKDSVETRLSTLGQDEKVEEIARMLGGVKITEQTLAHAREMLESA
ncbi:DNA repair protein RecN [Halioglobus japonicus]|uniref:DNA repair protein RecN n=2 Tax=Halioglobus japonicus TaxID=930805 RepID=A0AAP8MF11_9GAMM|nr:DNA repair protein RecN [Halioglobus japonicus]AQA18233.1 DNA repair protein RecN [Halioglobus japonicus]PLW86239.1 DNA repair protein RecN [Halioglobus japonicus]GHD13764.1 DNA repair protein RecN [Halioglobus japonicus]